jgi:hypothetical protein
MARKSGATWQVKGLGLAALVAPGCAGTPPDSPHHLVRTNTASTGNFVTVAGSSATDVWAVGENGTTATGVSNPVVAHFDGHTWTEQTVPGAQQVSRVVAFSPTQVWVGGLDLNGSTGVFRWDGAAWTKGALPDCSGHPLLQRADTELWVACEGNASISVFRFDGTTFQDVSPKSLTTLGPVPATLFGNGPSNMFVGDLSVLGHWDGTAWATIKNPGPDENGILGFLGVPNIPQHVNTTSDGQLWFMAAGLNRWDSKAPSATRVTDTDHAYGQLAVVSPTEAYWSESIDGSKTFTTTSESRHCHHLHNCFETSSTSTHHFPDFVLNTWDGKGQAYIRAADHDHEAQIISLWAAGLSSVFVVDDDGLLWTVE